MNNNKNELTYQTPIYIQLREIIREKIEEGIFPPGVAIPSENELANTYGINRITVRNAVDALVLEGSLYRIQGKGVFVVGQKSEQDLETLGGFISSVNKNLTSTKTKVQTKCIRLAGQLYGKMFNLNEDDEIYYIRQIVYKNNDPATIEDYYLPKQIIPKLDEIDSSVFDMHDLLSFYGVDIFSMEQALEIVQGSTKIRKLLKTPENSALIMMEGTLSTPEGQSVLFYRFYNRSDLIKYKINLHK